MRYCLLFLFLWWGTAYTAPHFQETLTYQSQKEAFAPLREQHQEQTGTYCFGSVGLMMAGGGLSHEWKYNESQYKTNFEGQATLAFGDPAVIGLFSVDTTKVFPATRGLLGQLGGNIQVGVGATMSSPLHFVGSYPFPYIPIRWSLRGSYGFLEVGAKLYFGLLPLPEIRVGLGVPNNSFKSMSQATRKERYNKKRATLKHMTRSDLKRALAQ